MLEATPTLELDQLALSKLHTLSTCELPNFPT